MPSIEEVPCATYGVVDRTATRPPQERKIAENTRDGPGRGVGNTDTKRKKAIGMAAADTKVPRAQITPLGMPA